MQKMLESNDTARVAPTETPVALETLPASARALLTPSVIARWTDGLAPDDRIDAGEIVRLEQQRRRTLDTLRHGIELTDQEFALLRLLQRREGQTVTLSEIVRHLWPQDARGASEQQLWDRHGHLARHARGVHKIMHNIRRKIEIDILRPQHLVSIRSVGYRWYAAIPARDDGEDYAARSDEAREMRYRIRGYRGELPPPRDPVGRFSPGPEHPDYAAIDANVTHRRSSTRARS